jgi:hypothetical protein
MNNYKQGKARKGKEIFIKNQYSQDSFFMILITFIWFYEFLFDEYRS